MRKILKDISKSEEPDLEPRVNQECMYECIKRGFITGVTARRCTNNEYGFDNLDAAFITYDGVQFLENRHPGWQTTFNTVLGVISLIFSALSLILAFLSNFFDIGAAFEHLI